MARKPEQLDSVEEVVSVDTQEEIKQQPVKKEVKNQVEDKRVTLINTQNYSIFVSYFKDECLVPPRARVTVIEAGLPQQLPNGIHKL